MTKKKKKKKKKPAIPPVFPGAPLSKRFKKKIKEKV